jgi:hypothetical protein
MILFLWSKKQTNKKPMVVMDGSYRSTQFVRHTVGGNGQLIPLSLLFFSLSLFLFPFISLSLSPHLPLGRFVADATIIETSSPKMSPNWHFQTLFKPRHQPFLYLFHTVLHTHLLIFLHCGSKKSFTYQAIWILCSSKYPGTIVAVEVLMLSINSLFYICMYLLRFFDTLQSQPSNLLQFALTTRDREGSSTRISYSFSLQEKRLLELLSAACYSSQLIISNFNKKNQPIVVMVYSSLL